MNEFFSQFGEDKWLVENIFTDPNERGVFIDIGAGHFANGSNTFYFEQRGWNGVCVDADPRNYDLLLNNRKRCVFGVASDHYGLTKFFMNKTSPDISRTTSVGNETEVILPCFPTTDIVKAFVITKLDLLSVDVEGDEVKVLKNFFTVEPKVYPRVIIVEFKTLEDDHANKIEELFKDLPYKKVHTTEANFIYQFKNYV